jgi:hypothetical protein
LKLSIKLTSDVGELSYYHSKMFALRAVVFLFLCVSLVFCEGEVVDLNLSNFEHLTQASTGATTGDWLVKFYAPWFVTSFRLV